MEYGSAQPSDFRWSQTICCEGRHARRDMTKPNSQWRTSNHEQTAAFRLQISRTIGLSELYQTPCTHTMMELTILSIWLSWTRTKELFILSVWSSRGET